MFYCLYKKLNPLFVPMKDSESAFTQEQQVNSGAIVIVQFSYYNNSSV